jgi:hypothetical protein
MTTAEYSIEAFLGSLLCAIEADRIFRRGRYGEQPRGVRELRQRSCRRDEISLTMLETGECRSVLRAGNERKYWLCDDPQL